MKNIIQIIIVLSMVGFLYPCSCQEIPPPEEAYEMSNVVFSGQVTNIIEDWNNGFMEISIDVYNVWKGTIDNQIIILTGLDDCGYYFQLNEEYLIYGYYSQMNHIWTDICTRTNLLEDSEEDLEFLNSLNNILCSEEECGPPPMMPNYLCFDGITIAGPGDCIESIIGECYWEIIDCPTTIGYLRENEVSDCQDACSQYYIEPEIGGGFGTIPIIFQNQNVNIDLFLNRFVEVSLGQQVTCVECNAYEVTDINLSDDCEFIVDCFQDPCIDDEECDINTAVTECIPNFCGGCYADYYDLNDNLIDCTVTIEECFDFTGIDFGACTMALGIGLLNNECSYISGCDWIIDDIDYSNLFFNSIEECEENCDIDNPIDLGDINFDGETNILDVVLLVSFILGDPPDEYEYIAGDINQDSLLNILDIVLLIELILNPENSIQINSGTSYGECWGYCVFELELELENSNALFTASSWSSSWYDEFLDLLLAEDLNQEAWQQLVNLIDFEYFQSLEDVYGCPDCADGGAEFIEIIYNGDTKQVTFEAYTEIDGIQELTIFLRNLRADYWNQINENQECYIIPEVGPCDGICSTYYYNQDSNECEEFIFGCCGPEAFNTMEECQNSCE